MSSGRPTGGRSTRCSGGPSRDSSHVHVSATVSSTGRQTRPDARARETSDRCMASWDSPGGSQIIGYVAQALIAILDWDMNVQQAVALPHLVNRFGTFEIEAGTGATQQSAALREIGFEVKEGDLNSGLHAIAITPEGLGGGADPRREGLAIGDVQPALRIIGRQPVMMQECPSQRCLGSADAKLPGFVEASDQSGANRAQHAFAIHDYHRPKVVKTRHGRIRPIGVWFP